MTEVRYDCFVSYSSQDRALARQLVDALESRDKSVWWDEELRGSTGDWRQHIGNAIFESRAVVVLVTANAARSPEVRRELEFAEKVARRPIVPLLAGDLSGEPTARGLLYLLATHQRIEALDGSLTDGVIG